MAHGRINAMLSKREMCTWGVHFDYGPVGSEKGTRRYCKREMLLLVCWNRKSPRGSRRVCALSRLPVPWYESSHVPPLYSTVGPALRVLVLTVQPATTEDRKYVQHNTVGTVGRLCTSPALRDSMHKPVRQSLTANTSSLLLYQAKVYRCRHSQGSTVETTCAVPYLACEVKYHAKSLSFRRFGPRRRQDDRIARATMGPPQALIS